MLKIKPKTVMIAIPAYGGVVHTSCMESCLALLGPAKQANIDLSFLITNGDSLVTRARNTIVNTFMKSKQDYLLFVDSDIGFTPDAFLRLVQSGYKLCGTAYPKKEIDWKKILKIAKDCKDEWDLRMKAANYVLNFADPQNVKADGKGFVEVQDIGTGFMLIHRDVFAEMASAYPELRHGGPVDSQGNQDEDPHYAFFDTEIEKETGAYLSEDWFFCRQWQRLGRKVWLDVTQPLSHTGMYAFHGKSAAVFLPQTKDQTNAS